MRKHETVSDPRSTMDERSGRFVTTHAEDGSAIVRDVDSGQVITLSSNPGLDSEDVIEATIAPDPPLHVSWQVIDVDTRWRIEVIESDLEPTSKSRSIADEMERGSVEQFARKGAGEVHVMLLPPDRIESAIDDIRDDVETIVRAARLEADRVELRSDIDAGILCVRYLPD